MGLLDNRQNRAALEDLVEHHVMIEDQKPYLQRLGASVAKYAAMIIIPTTIAGIISSSTSDAERAIQFTGLYGFYLASFTLLSMGTRYLIDAPQRNRASPAERKLDEVRTYIHHHDNRGLTMVRDAVGISMTGAACYAAFALVNLGSGFSMPAESAAMAVFTHGLINAAIDDYEGSRWAHNLEECMGHPTDETHYSV